MKMSRNWNGIKFCPTRIVALVILLQILGTGTAYCGDSSNRTQNGNQNPNPLGGWQSQNSGTSNNLRAVCFIDINNGWAVGETGVLLNTSNGGMAWSPQQSGISTHIVGVDFVDPNNGWTVGDNGVILHTSNGGANWNTQSSGVSSNLYKVDFFDFNNGWAVGYNGVIRHTSNGGGIWTGQSSGTSVRLHCVDFVDANNGWIVGEGGLTLHTSNGGATWTPQTSGTSNVLIGVSFVNLNNGWAAGDAGTVVNTTDGGATWNTQTSMTSSTLRRVDFVDLNNGWAFGQAGTILHTSNGGMTWNIQPCGSSIDFNGGDFVDFLNGWAVGLSGTILHTATGGVNTPPVAHIDSISPNPAIQGQSVTFMGHGTDTDGTVTEYNWTSSIDGKLSSSATFSTSSLSLGAHTISFTVKDNDNAWSVPMIQTLTIVPFDPFPPHVLSNSPVGNNVPLNAQVTVIFNESMNKTATEGAFSINPSVSGTKVCTGDTLTFTPATNYTANTKYTVTISTAAEDLSGNNLQNPFTWDFTTIQQELLYVSGNYQEALVDTDLSAPFAVKVTNSTGAPLQNARIDWSIQSAPSGSTLHSLANQTDYTDSSGLAYNDMHIGEKPGTYIVEANCSGAIGSPFHFEANATAGPIDHIAVAPSSASLSIGNTRRFNASGFDQFDNLMTGMYFNWAVSGNIGTVDTAYGNETNFTATDAGSGTVDASASIVSGSASVYVNPQVDHINITPPSAIILPGGYCQFNATAYDAQGQVIQGVVFSWNVVGNIGTVTSAGWFHATTIGSGSVTATAGGVTGSASVLVTSSPQLNKILISPDSVTMYTTDLQTFTGKAFDQNNVIIVGISFTWSVTGSIGTVNPMVGNGTTFTASAQGTGTLLATNSSVTGTASVTVLKKPGALYRVDITPANVQLRVGKPCVFNATCYDQNNNKIIHLPVTWSLSSSELGTLSTTTGFQVTFTAGIKAVKGKLFAQAVENSNIKIGEAVVNVTMPPPIVVNVLYLKAGDVLYAGSAFNIRWTATGGEGQLKINIDYAAESPSWMKVAENETNDGTYSWSVPSNCSDSCYLRITATDSTLKSNSTIVGPFSIRGQSGSISGRVVDDRGKAINGATVELLYAANSTMFKIKVTGADGRFNFTSLSLDNYTVKVTAVGYQDQEVNDIEVASSKLDMDVGDVVLTPTASVSGFGLWMWIGVVVIIVVIVIALVAALAMRRKPLVSKKQKVSRKESAEEPEITAPEPEPEVARVSAPPQKAPVMEHAVVFQGDIAGDIGREEVFKFIVHHPGSDERTISKSLEIRQESVRRHAEALEKEGKIFSFRDPDRSDLFRYFPKEAQKDGDSSSTEY